MIYSSGLIVRTLTAFGIQRVIKGTSLLVLTLIASAVSGTLRGHWKDANFKPVCGRGDIRIPGLGLGVPLWPEKTSPSSICRKISLLSRRGSVAEHEKERQISF